MLTRGGTFLLARIQGVGTPGCRGRGLVPSPGERGLPFEDLPSTCINLPVQLSGTPLGFSVKRLAGRSQWSKPCGPTPGMTSHPPFQAMSSNILCPRPVFQPHETMEAADSPTALGPGPPGLANGFFLPCGYGMPTPSSSPNSHTSSLPSGLPGYLPG